jgi:hypothetical protein
MAVALSEGEAFLLIFAVAVPIAALAFFGAGAALKNIGKGRFAVQFEDDLDQKPVEAPASPGTREAEIRQMVEAKAYRQTERGEEPLDVDEEVRRLLDEGKAADLGTDPDLVTEVRQLVIARNERRARRGEEPLDVDAEVERRIRELENLGQ